jgi:membrane protein implicated in regulation of membrane protease activity
MEILFSELGWWHWIALALLLFGIEMMSGTFDLLMVSIASLATALFAGLAPESIASWQVQLLVFAVAAAGMVIAGRTLFADARKSAPEHPTLNKRMQSLIGQSGEVTRDIDGGHGQVKIGDTVWGAEAAEGEAPMRAGEKIVVAATRANMAIVRKA